MLEKNEEAIVKAITSGDEVVLYAFYKNHKRGLFRFILKYINNSQDAEEVLQDTFLSFIDSLRDFRGGSSLKTFLYSIAKNKSIDKIRKKKIKQILFSALPENIVNSMAVVFLEDELDKKAIATAIEKVLSKLPNDYQTVLRLKYKENCKVGEIAEEMSLSFKATESLLYRARQAFIFSFNNYDR